MGSSNLENFDELSRILSDVSQAPEIISASELLNSIKLRFVEIFENPETFTQAYCANVLTSFEALIPELEPQVLPFFSFFSTGLESLLQLSNPPQNVINKYYYFYESPHIFNLLLSVRPEFFSVFKFLAGKTPLSSDKLKPLVNLCASEYQLSPGIVEYVKNIVNANFSFKHSEELKNYSGLAAGLITRSEPLLAASIFETALIRSIRWFVPERNDSAAYATAAVRCLIKAALASQIAEFDFCEILLKIYKNLIPLNEEVYSPLFTLYSTLYGISLNSNRGVAQAILSLYSDAHVLYTNNPSTDSLAAEVDKLIEYAIKKTDLADFLEMLPLNIGAENGRAWLLKRIESAEIIGNAGLIAEFFEHIKFFRGIASNTSNTTLLINLSALINSCFNIISKLLAHKNSFEQLYLHRDNDSAIFYSVLSNVHGVIQNFLEEPKNASLKEAAEAVTKGLISLLEKGDGPIVNYLLNETYGDAAAYIPATIYACFLLEGDVSYDNLALQFAQLSAKFMTENNLDSFISLIFRRKNVAAGRIFTLFNAFLKGALEAENPHFPLKHLESVLSILSGGENTTKLDLSDLSASFFEKRFYSVSLLALKYLKKHALLDANIINFIGNLIGKGATQGEEAVYVSESARAAYIDVCDFLYEIGYFTSAEDNFLVSRVVSFLVDAQSKTINSAIAFIKNRFKNSASSDNILALIVSGLVSDREEHVSGCLFLFEGILAEIWPQITQNDANSILKLSFLSYNQNQSTSIKIQSISVMREWVSMASSEQISQEMPEILANLLKFADANPNSKTRSSVQNLIRKIIQKCDMTAFSRIESKTLSALIRENSRKSKISKKSEKEDFIGKLHKNANSAEIEDVVIEKFDPKFEKNLKKIEKISKKFQNSEIKKTDKTIEKIRERKLKQSKVPHHKRTLAVKKGASANPFAFRKLDPKNYK